MKYNARLNDYATVNLHTDQGLSIYKGKIKCITERGINVLISPDNCCNRLVCFVKWDNVRELHPNEQ